MSWMKNSRWALGAIMLALASVAQAADAPAETALPHGGWDLTELKNLPVQSGGRMKPLDSFARETVLFMTGKTKYEGWDSVDLLLSWIASPQSWEARRFVQVARPDVRRQLGLDEDRKLFTPQELFNNYPLLQYSETIGRTEGPGAQVSTNGKTQAPREQEMTALLERLSLFRSLVSGHAWVMIPTEAGKPWASLAGQDPAGEKVRAHFADLLRAYQAADQARFAEASVGVRSTVESLIPGWDTGHARVVKAETFYNRWHPFMWAWLLYLAAALTGLLFQKTSKQKVSFGLLFAAFLIHTVGIGLRCYIAGRPPVTNMYESIIWVAYGAVIFSGILYLIQRQMIVLIVSSVLATASLIAADAAPAMMDPGLHPLVAVLRSNYWLTVHVLTITLGYAAFALCLGLGNVTLWQYLRPSEGWMARVQNLNLLTYRATQFGVVLLGAGTILGGIWADESWGRFWGWDPKEVWALIAFLCYVAILHGRYTNWMGQFGFAAWSVVGFLSVLMAWYGVNFVLGAGLHSYGFSSGGLGWVSLFTVLQLAYVGFVALVKNGKVRLPQAAS